jgi:2-oxoglutarate ferredoxin oxidoreductase subunit beta
MTEIIASLGGVAYAERVAVNNIKNIKKAQKAVRKAFDYQVQGLGFSFVEVLATCPTNWRMTPQAANTRIETEMIPYFPLGVYKDVKAQEDK